MAMPENEEKPVSTVKELEVNGYSFKVDTDLLDDVETFELVDRIENKGQIVAIVPLLNFLLGDKGYAEMKAYFAKQDAEEHKETPDYKGRFRLTKLQDVYKVIVTNFNPKA